MFIYVEDFFRFVKKIRVKSLKVDSENKNHRL